MVDKIDRREYLSVIFQGERDELHSQEQTIPFYCIACGRNYHLRLTWLWSPSEKANKLLESLDRRKRTT